MTDIFILHPAWLWRSSAAEIGSEHGFACSDLWLLVENCEILHADRDDVAAARAEPNNPEPSNPEPNNPGIGM